MLSLLLLAALSPSTPALDPQALAQEQPEGRPQAPYSLPPSTATARGTQGAPAPQLAAPDAEPAAERPETLDDSIPLPEPAAWRADPSGDVLERPAGGDPSFLGFAAGSHRPPAGESVDPELYANARTSYPDGRPSPDTYAFVMFTKRMSAERLSALEALGCRLLGFHPHYTQKVALPAQAIDPVAALDFVRWVGVPRAWQKVHPALASELASAPAGELVPVWISVFESDLGPSASRVLGLPPTFDGPAGRSLGESEPLADVWITDGWQQRSLEALGVEVLSYSERARAFRARVAPAGLDLVTGLDFVLFVDPILDAHPANDETMPMAGLDVARTTYDGGTSLRTVAGFVDSGLSTGHQDLDHFNSVGYDPTGGNPFQDQCGHGTWVGGSLLGSGDVEPAHRGGAPGLGWGMTGRLYIYKLWGGLCGGSVNVPEVLSRMVTPISPSPKPHLVNNSWGISPLGSAWIGSETEARLYDDNSYVNAQLQVFSAGNQGPTSGTVGLPAVAKNVLTVGSVDDFDDGASAGKSAVLTTNSSRGPCGDSRWKPSLVAPGKWVTSASASNPSGYVTLSGTSAAASHVTAAAADLIDADGSYQYFPEMITSRLMASATRKDNELLTAPSDPALDDYGAGRVDAATAIWGAPGATLATWAFSLNATSSTFSDFTVPSGATRLVVVLNYSDPSASAGASQALVNDFDLFIDRPPLSSGNNTGEYSAQQSHVDNTEIRILSNPIPGTWRWKVWPTSAVTTAFFGVTVYAEVRDTTPDVAPVLTASPLFAQPGAPVRFDYSLSTPGSQISSVFLEAAATTPNSLLGAHTNLEDGPVSNLLFNQHGGWNMNLGNVHPDFPRSASWDVAWVFEGIANFWVASWADNASSSPLLTNAPPVIIDGTAPGLPNNLKATVQQPGVWSKVSVLNMQWNPAVDPLSVGVASGLDGYSWSLTGGPTLPPATKTLAATVGSFTSAPLASGTHWFNLRAVDRAGNWGGAANAGPYLIDTLSPSPVSGLVSLTHQVNVVSCDPGVTMDWTNATDTGGSGVAGYGVSWDHAQFGSAPSTVNVTASQHSTALGSSSLPWYFHVRAIDNAGNGGVQIDAGPYYVDLGPTAIYCTAKVNSQGCTPQIDATGLPKLSASTLVVTAGQVLNNKVGLLYWGHAPASTPFQGGTKCVASPTKRTATQGSGGNPPPDDCSGSYSFTFSSSYMAAKGIGVGDTIYCQYWSRDPSAPFTTGLTNALSFTVCP